MKETLKITELIGELCPDELGVPLERPPVFTERVLDILRARGVLTRPTARRKRRGPRLAARLAIAAALILALSVTAWAVYQALMEDYLVQTPTQLDAVMEDMGMDPSPGSTLSLVGYQGTPEYEAYTQWEVWQAEHYGDHPMDNSTWHETPDNYYEFYGAAWQDQADALDRITAKYGVRLHEDMAFADAEQIYQLLGAEPFLPDIYDWAEGYIYNDGTFKLEFARDQGDTSDSGSIFVSVKGTITDISGAVGSGEYQEWSYRTASGPTVDLVLRSGGTILCETGSAYIQVNVHTQDNMSPEALVPYTREDLQAIANSIDFGELARLFGPGAAFDLTDAVKELDTAHEQQLLAIGERLRQQAEEDYRRSLEVVEKLGVYEPDPVPEGYEAGTFAWADLEQTVTAHGASYDGAETLWGAMVSEDCVDRSYANAAGECFYLSYTRYYTDESRSVSATAEQFAAAKTYYAAFEGFQECQVNGCAGFYFPAVQGTIFDPGVMWLDETHDLVFMLDMSVSYFDVQTGQMVCPGGPFTTEELIALAATVTAK